LEGARLKAVLTDSLTEMERLIAIAETSPARTPAAIEKRLKEQLARLLRLRPAERRDRVERVEQEVRLDLRLQPRELGVGRGARSQVELLVTKLRAARPTD